MDLASFTSDYVATIEGGISRDAVALASLANEIAEAYAEQDPELESLSDADFLEVAHNSIAPQVAYYLPAPRR